MKVKEPDLTEQIREIFGTTDVKELRRIAEDAACYRKKGNSAKKYHVSRQTIYSQIKRVHNFSEDPDVKMRMYFMNRDYLCTMIDIDFLHEKIYIKNYTDQIPLRAFGVVDNPSWNDFEYFLEDRCFPRTRDHAKEILRDMRIPFYDPLLIIEKTDGYMEGDHQWIMMVKKER